MNSARDRILQRIRSANLQQEGLCATDVLEQRVLEPARGPQPAWQEKLIERFTKKVQESVASLEPVKTVQAIAEATSTYVSANGLDNKLLCGSNELIKSLEWPDTISVEYRSATIEDKVVLVEAFAGIAETGSIVMCSGASTPVSLNFLPDHFLCVISAERIVKNIEDLWQKIRDEQIIMPRAINIITGPSRTADVEQIIQLGAHGPRKVHLLLLQ